MVHTIDATARRRALAEAVWRIVQRDGLAAASVRSVARETGLSTGSVRHFFGTQRELITFAMRELVDTVTERVAVSAQIADPEERVVAVLREMLPLTEASHAEASAFFQFVSHAPFEPSLEAIATESFARIHDACRQIVVILREAGRAAVDIDVPTTARTLWGLIDGLSVQLLYAPHLVSAADADATIRHYLRSLA